MGRRGDANIVKKVNCWYAGSKSLVSENIIQGDSGEKVCWGRW